MIISTKNPNKRVEYAHLCEIEKSDYSAQGLEREFDKDTRVVWCTSKELEELGTRGPTLELVKKIAREHIKV